MKESYKIKVIFVEIILLFVLSLVLFFNSYSFFFMIVSDSMNPYIYKNDIVLVKKIDRELGDYKNKVIAYYNPLRSAIMVHRAVDRNGEYLLTKGDNSPWTDFYRVPRSKIIGDIVFVVKSSKLFK